MGASGGDREAGALPLAALGVAATEAKVVLGIFRGVLLGAGQGHPAALRGSCRGAPLCHAHLDPAPVHLT